MAEQNLRVTADKWKFRWLEEGRKSKSGNIYHLAYFSSCGQIKKLLTWPSDAERLQNLDVQLKIFFLAYVY